MANETVPEPGPHHAAPNKLLTIFVIFIEALALVALVLVTKYTVVHWSGLNEPDKVHRIWARAPEIRFQPIPQPLLYAVGVGFGAQTVVYAVVVSVLNAIGLKVAMFGVFGYFLTILSTSVPAILSVLIYRAGGGEDWRIAALSNYGFSVVMTWFILWVTHIGALLIEQIGEEYSKAVYLVIFLSPLILYLVLQVPFAVYAANRKLPATARLIYNSTVVPNWVKLDRTLLAASGPLAVIYIFSHFVENYFGSHTYLTRVSHGLASLMVLSMSALAAIISVNRALLSNEFQWQWRAFLTPAVPLTIVSGLFGFWFMIRGHINFGMFIYSMVHRFLSYGSCGALGAYVYLLLAERYARLNFDEDMYAQSDLLAEYDEDEDNEELEV